MFFLSHIWLIPLLPAFGAAIMFFFGRRLQKATVSAVCVGSIVLAFVMACGAVWQYSAWSSTEAHFQQPYQTILYTWLGTDTGHMNYTTHDGSAAASGGRCTRTVDTEPSSRRDAKAISPPISVTISLQIARPSPVPP